MNTKSKPSSSESDVKNYRRIRKFIGYLGLSLPLILVIFSLIPIFSTSVQSSISSYYYTNFREIFTGILSAVSLFLICYQGPEKTPKPWENDTLLTNIAGVLALLIALFPTNPEVWSGKIYTIAPWHLEWLGWLHYAFAGLFFIILAYISMMIFPLGQKPEKGTPDATLNENNIYKICGSIILLCVILIPVSAWLELFSYSTLVFEAIALLAFGTTWLIKGRALGDKGRIGRVLYREKN
jgi:cell division protein FtsW (lipid II flippase)